MSGHLELPVRHVPTILDLGDADAADLILEVRRAAHMIDAAYARPGIAIWQNNGVPAHQTVAHLHVHVAGTLPDRGGTDWGPVPRLPSPPPTPSPPASAPPHCECARQRICAVQ